MLKRWLRLMAMSQLAPEDEEDMTPELEERENDPSEMMEFFDRTNYAPKPKSEKDDSESAKDSTAPDSDQEEEEDSESAEPEPEDEETPEPEDEEEEEQGENSGEESSEETTEGEEAQTGLDGLIERMNQMAVATFQAAQPEQQESTEEAGPSVVPFIPEGEDALEAVQENSQNFNAVLNKVKDVAVEIATRNMAKFVQESVKHRFDMKEVTDDFFDRNRDLKRVKPLVAYSVSVLGGKNPDKKLGALLEEAGKEVRSFLKVKGAPSGTKGKRTGSGQSRAGSRRTTKTSGKPTAKKGSEKSDIAELTAFLEGKRS